MILRRPRPRWRTGLLTLVLPTALLVPAAPSVTRAAAVPGPSPHASDGVRGPLAPPLPAAARRVAVRSEEVSYRVVPGLRYRSWVETDARGPVRVHVLTANLRRPGLRLRYADPGRVAARERLGRIVRERGAVAGVNGDFFDIDDTGAPLGVGVAGGTVRHGTSSGWTASFRVAGRADASVGRTPVHVRVDRGPQLEVSEVNAPSVPRGGIGLYTRRWGPNPGYAVTDGAARRKVRQVVVRHGAVVANTRSLDAGASIEGTLLIGRGAGAAAMAERWPVGTPLRFEEVARTRPRVAIGGSLVLLRRGVVRTADDGELHPRTAVGVDRDTGRALLVVVDGRSATSRGMTLLELAELARGLGAEAALNLDGGGSSTMVAQDPTGAVRPVNEPSGGHQRPVPNALVLTYRAPTARR